MLVVKVELWSARTGKCRELGRTYIANVGGTQERGDYDAVVCRRNGSIDPREVFSGKCTRRGGVKDYPRLSYNVWRLVIRALLSCFPEEQSP